MASLNISLPNKVDTQDPEAIQKLNSYLYKLSEEIRYMFGNLTPEDNYSSEAYAKVVSGAEAQAKMEISLKQIELSYVAKDGVISAINLSPEGVKIKGKNIYLEGAITANVDANGDPTFEVDTDGIIHARGGYFTGTIEGSRIIGGYIGVYDDGEHENDPFWTSGNAVGIPGFIDTAGIFASTVIGTQTNAVDDSDCVLVMSKEGYVGCKDLYLIGNGWLTSIISDLWEAISDIDTGDDNPDQGGQNTGGGTGEPEIPGNGEVI